FAIEEWAADDEGCIPIVVEPNRAFVVPPFTHRFRLVPSQCDAAAVGSEELCLLATREWSECTWSTGQDDPRVGVKEHDIVDEAGAGHDTVSITVGVVTGAGFTGITDCAPYTAMSIASARW